MSSLNKQDWIEIYTNLNLWEWDSRLGDKPYDWDNVNNHTKHQIIKPYMTQIKLMIGEKPLLKHWHLNYCGMNRFQHEIWWLKNRVFGKGI